MSVSRNEDYTDDARGYIPKGKSNVSVWYGANRMGEQHFWSPPWKSKTRIAIAHSISMSVHVHRHPTAEGQQPRSRRQGRVYQSFRLVYTASWKSRIVSHPRTGFSSRKAEFRLCFAVVQNAGRRKPHRFPLPAYLFLFC